MVKCTTLKLQRNCFRPLNSEIGNDLMLILILFFADASFRLLNSEIGNDHENDVKSVENPLRVFVSLTRR